MPRAKLTKAQEREFKKDHARLYKAGLVSKPASKQKPTRHAIETHIRLKSFLEGKAQAVSVPRGKRKEYADKLTVAGDKVLVPITRKGERARYSKREGEIISTRTEGGIKVKRRLKSFSIEDLKKQEGKNTTFSVIIPRATGNEVFRTKTVDEMANIFARGSWRNFADWAKFVNVEKSERAREKIDGQADADV